MAFAFVNNRPFWDRFEYICTALSGGCSAFTASQTQDYKRIPASFAFFFAALVAVAKWQSKKIEEIEKREKARTERETQERNQEELTRLQVENDAGNEYRQRELESIRERHETAVKKMAGAILEHLHKKYFRQESKDSMHKHRVTLFVCEECDSNPGREKRLKIFARAGVYPESKVSWPLDDNDPDKCRGVAAQIWFHGVGTVKTAACDWPADGNMIQKVRYAESLGITVDEAALLNVKSTVFTGARIMARDKRWGVLLLDSLKEGHIKEAGFEKKLLADYVDLICSVLNRMES